MIGLATGFVPDATIDERLEATLVRLVEAPPEEAVGLLGTLDDELAGSDDAPSPLRILANDFANGFYLFALIEAELRQRRIVKFDYEESFLPLRQGDTSGTPATRRWSDRVVNGLSWLGIAPVQFFIEVSPGYAVTHHLEVAAPDELVIRRVELLYDRLLPSDRLSEANVDTGHLYVTRARRMTHTVAIVRFVLDPQGIPSAALFVAALTVAFLAGGLVADLRLHSGPAAEAAAVVVAVPGLYAAFLFRPGEHRLLRRLVRGLRVTVAGLATVSFAAAATLSLRLPHQDKLRAWEALLILAALGFAVTATAYMAARIRRSQYEGE